MKREHIVEFLNKEVAIGIPKRSSTIPFYFYGKLIDVGDQYITITLSNGYKSLLIDEIIEIHTTEGVY